MKTLSIVLRGVVTLAAIYGGYSVATDPSQLTPHWLIVPFEGILALMWAIIFWKLSSPLQGAWAVVLLAGLLFCMAALMSLLVPDGLSDLAGILLFAGVIVAWLLLLSVRWETAKRIGHALIWLMIIVPIGLAVSLPVLASAETSSLLAAVVLAVLLAAMVSAWMCAVLSRWSLKWPLIIVVVVLWPFGYWWIAMIGLGKLIIHAVGRSGDFAGSDIYEQPIVDARPRGLVEYASYE